MQPQLEFDRLQEHFRDLIQRRYEMIRPLVLFQDRTATQRAEETRSHPETIGTLTRRFAQQGMLGLLPGHLHIGPSGRRGRVPEAVVQALTQLKGLYDGFQYRELGRILWYKLDYRISDKTLKKLWHQLPPASPQQLPLLDYHSYPERSQAREQVIALYFKGGTNSVSAGFCTCRVPPSMSGLVVLRPTTWPRWRTRAQRRKPRYARCGCR
ncbi:MAG: hypothetical protein V3U27_16035 [Candidatus Tectomicrobia bacterium]